MNVTEPKRVGWKIFLGGVLLIAAITIGILLLVETYVGNKPWAHYWGAWSTWKGWMVIILTILAVLFFMLGLYWLINGYSKKPRKIKASK